MPRRRPDPFDHDTRDGAAYRAERLQEEAERLNRRLEWALRRSDAKGVQRLTERLEAIEDAIDDDLSPGRRSGRHEWYRRHR